MLIDFFVCVDFTREPPRQSPFRSSDAHKKLMYAEQEYPSDDAYLMSLLKRQNDRDAVYEDDTMTVFLFGYCFARLDSGHFSDITRLSARQWGKAYQELGDDLLEEVKGSFSVLLFHKTNRELLLFTDPLSVRPLYYLQHESTLVASTTLGAVVQWMHEQGLSPTLNEPAVIEYNLFEYVLNEDTYIQSVYTLPAGGKLRYTPQGLETEQYWNLMERLSNFHVQYNELEATERLEEVMKKNLDLYLFNPERTAVALTGGYDSRTNLALLGNRSKDFLFYSYGTEDTYDLSIPQKIADTLSLRFKAIHLDQQYLHSFNKNADLAIALGDGIAEANRANYLYAFKELGKGYDYILTGLFGSELIKHPTSVGNFISQDMRNLLAAEQPEAYVDELLRRAEKDAFSKEMIARHRETVKERLLTHPYVVNDHTFPIRYFYFLLGVGVRQYFSKEIKVERPFVENLHPFFDLEFIEVLMKTPFPWIYHWEGKRNLVKSIRTHKFYVSVIRRNHPKLTRMLSTHGYTPYYLLYKPLLPLLSVQYLYYKDRIKSKGSFRSSEAVWTYFKQFEPTISTHGPSMKSPDNVKNLIKVSSLKRWLDKYAVPHDLPSL